MFLLARRPRNQPAMEDHTASAIRMTLFDFPRHGRCRLASTRLWPGFPSPLGSLVHPSTFPQKFLMAMPRLFQIRSFAVKLYGCCCFPRLALAPPRTSAKHPTSVAVLPRPNTSVRETLVPYPKHPCSQDVLLQTQDFAGTRQLDVKWFFRRALNRCQALRLGMEIRRWGPAEDIRR